MRRRPHGRTPVSDGTTSAVAVSSVRKGNWALSGAIGSSPNRVNMLVIQPPFTSDRNAARVLDTASGVVFTDRVLLTCWSACEGRTPTSVRRGGAGCGECRASTPCRAGDRGMTGPLLIRSGHPVPRALRALRALLGHSGAHTGRRNDGRPVLLAPRLMVASPRYNYGRCFRHEGLAVHLVFVRPHHIRVLVRKRAATCRALPHYGFIGIDRFSLLKHEAPHHRLVARAVESLTVPGR